MVEYYAIIGFLLLNTLLAVYPLAQSQATNANDDDGGVEDSYSVREKRTIIFPDMFRLPQAKGLNCKDNICEDAKNYPSDFIEDAIKNSTFQDFLSDTEPIFVNRFSEVDEDGFANLCETQEVLLTPKVAKNSDNKDVFIVNTEKYRQEVVARKCLKKQCQLNNEFPSGYVTECKQGYTVRKLIAIDSDKKEIVREKIEVPSCCVCSYRRVKVE